MTEREVEKSSESPSHRAGRAFAATVASIVIAAVVISVLDDLWSASSGQIVLYQLVAGVLLALSGGAAAGWAMVAFLGPPQLNEGSEPGAPTGKPAEAVTGTGASHAARTELGPAVEVTFTRSPIDRRSIFPGNDSFGERWIVIRDLHLDTPLAQLPEIGPGLAKGLALFSIRTLRELAAAPDDLFDGIRGSLSASQQSLDRARIVARISVQLAVAPEPNQPPPASQPAESPG